MHRVYSAALAAFGALTSFAAQATPTAEVALLDASATLVQTGDTEWLLEKEGALSGSTVSWVIGATEQQTVAGQLRVQGQMTVVNTGSGPATIGNIVVNLQQRVNKKWLTLASDVADATDGDDATTASIHANGSSEGLSTFTENSASGTLQFMDATNNTMFSLVPQLLLGAGETRPLLFQASFDNNVLGLAVGTPVRAEVIVSFGNATQSGNSTANVDINGNGSIDADESRIRSVPTRLTLEVPAPVDGNATVTLTDTLEDIATTGTVSFSNAQFDLSATTGTVTITVDGGTDGGTITNCAHLTSEGQTVTAGGFTFPMINGVDLESCSTITVGATSCTPGAPGCGWETGDLVTFGQGDWGSTSGTAQTLLSGNYNAVYSATGGVLVVGTLGSVGFSMGFTNAPAITNYLPATGAPGALTSDLVNPTTTASGSFGGSTVALKLNIDFSDANLTGGTATVAFGDVLICGAEPLANMTVRSFLAVAKTALGGGSTGYAFSDLDSIATQLNGSFRDGPSVFAQQHLFSGTCP